MDEDTEIENLMENVNLEYMLEFETDIFLNMIPRSQCALAIVAKGLNLDLVIFNILKVYCDPGNLILVLNASDGEEKYFRDKLKNENVHNINSGVNAADREEKYLSGGIHFITTRILVVDLLKNRICIDKITGLIVLRAHKIFESCQEAFALRLFRQGNKTGFVKAFTNSPESFTMGYCHVEKVMRALFVKGLFIWPRFHGLVRQSLKEYEPQVIELHVPISDSMKKLQSVLLELMNITVNELKKITNALDIPEITVENCLIKKFHKILQAQLDLIWNQLGGKSKQLVSDLRTLRQLLMTLFCSDTVTFYNYVMQYQTRDYTSVAHWVYFKPADMFFSLAKALVFSGNREFNPEFCGKWKVLLELLKVEIPNEIKSSNYKDSTVLILCSDQKTCHQLSRLLTDGPHLYLLTMALKKKIKFSALSKQFKDSCGDVQHIFAEDEISDIGPKETKRTKKEQSEGGSSKKIGSEDQTEESEDTEEYQSTYILTMSQNILEKSSDDFGANDTTFEPVSQLENMDLSQMCESLTRPKILIQTFKANNNYVSLQNTLEILKPQYIVLYHSNVTAVREIEMYEAHRRNETPCKIYFLMHTDTVEEQAYLTALRREKEAFETLIETKRTMVIPEDQDGKSDHCAGLQRGITQPSKDTRKGGQEDGPHRRLVIVDMREFRSDLPHLIYKRGIDIEPVTLAIGDYILTPEICVERKSLSDLIGSLDSGRLYQQCIQMMRYYTKPMLLIEFDVHKSFGWQKFIMGDDIENFGIQQKLLLLTIHFPKLKIIWSHGPYATAQLFDELKHGKSEPKVVEAKALGGGEADLDLIESKYNTNLYDFLEKLPGLNMKNIHEFLRKGHSLREVLSKSEEELKELLGNTADAKAFFSILHEEHIEKQEPEPKFKKGGKFKSFRRNKC
ncbi:DNA repair endonuclease XPF isoform X2 [Cylas formicarius]|uniref:DNA repair endonuclease XPF isoform X2 n=1 Tax=Cylas formicarius TaxID=197179 RepID=UPI002958C3D5|nr:DNA repair endonuclease XPF isoform X2 [Cylas formicarius]